MERYKEIERDLITKYRKNIYRPFSKAIRDYHLIEENDKIALCISGGKDSMLMAKLMEEIRKHGPIKFELEYIVMDPGYKETTINQIKKNAEILNIKIKIYKSDIFAVSEKLNKEHPCYMCARMRRGFLYQTAKDLGCNKIALGHHFDDVVETVLLSMMYGGEFKSMRPILDSTNFEGMKLIRPLYLIQEKEIIKWATNNNLKFINCACKMTENIELENKVSKRKEIKDLIKKLEQNNPNIKFNIFKSTENINIDTILGYKKNNIKYDAIKK
ncbi:MAG: tRNA 2-thiocytidine biosynthesis protein TtcA [Bacilli bacterium]|nr:tRNA 2-thiocytidine biosynthesis protein TtcA [Bacilli bacterium]